MTTGKPAPAGMLPYLETTEDRYAEEAARTFSVVEAGPGDFVLRGPCPRCGTIVDIPVVDEFFRGSLTLAHAPQSAAGGDFVEPVICTCDDDHPNRPGERFGCGAYWTFIITGGFR